MCILCIIQKWSRRVATMLPWLVIPLIGLWALSQALPPAYRFEITSPRLACVFVLLVTLFWYEVLMPRLSSWRARRNHMLRERKRFEAIELQKLRKTATRRCRNCLTPYREQNPGGGKFMCAYCGHISKRPVLDLPVPPGLVLSNSGILKDLVGRSGKILSRKVWSDRRWTCGQDWIENGKWVGGSFPAKSSYWSKNGGGFFNGDHCLAKKSYFRVFVFACKALTAVYTSIVWLCRKIFRTSSSGDDASVDAERRGMLDKRGENGGNCQESKGEKARRKAEEKRQARLEKELLEEEERKQREEVARLVEERRRLRDEKMEAEKERGKGSSPKERESKKESEKRHQEKKKERDRGSSKSNSDVEELEKRAGKEGERSKRNENDRREQKFGSEFSKAQNTESGHGFKGANANNHNRGNNGTRYFDRMRGTFLSSSRALTGGGFFGKSPSTAPKEHKSCTSIDYIQAYAPRKEPPQPDRFSVKPNLSGDDRNINHPVLIEPQPCTAPKKSWQQLFTRSSAVSPPSNSNVIRRPNGKSQAGVHSPPYSSHSPPMQAFDNPINFGLPSPFNLSSLTFGPTSSSTSLPLSSETMFPRIGEPLSPLLPEESETYEDPSYETDPVTLLGPVSESLDNFHRDLGFVTDTGLEKLPAANNLPASSEVTTRPSPIESPISRPRVPEERHTNSFLFPTTPKAKDLPNVPKDASSEGNDAGEWQMWKSSPLGQDSLGLIGGSSSWLLNQEPNRLNREEIIPPAPQKTMASLFKKDDQVLPGVHSLQSGGTFSTSMLGSTDSRFSNPLIEKQYTLKPKEEGIPNEMIYGSPNAGAANHLFELCSTNSWAKKEWSVHGTGESVGISPVSNVGGLYSTPNAQSLWSYD
ncbi:PREDICTED: stress response protein NST1-like [Ipomoea nil]|uniref:stress response protein NST1-like n=1 Tax=Ipomoea nil TaxID=35883 RepID=UPI000900BA48|nr:PREDICTED: stress response protein NST1-like [Ipomoea nil]